MAYCAALPVFDKELQRRAAVDGQDARVAAAKGLIAAGVDSPADIDAITKAMRERGVTQRGEHTSLIWGDLKSENGRDEVGITTALHRDEERVLVASARAAGDDRTAALTPAQIANTALEEGVNIVGLSILSGSHVTLVTEELTR